MDRSIRPDLPDGPAFWLGMGAIVAALGVGGMAMAVSLYHPPWSSGWFIAGAAVSALGCLCAFWSLVLYLARKQAAGHWCPDPQAHITQAAQLNGHPDQTVAEKLQGVLEVPTQGPISTGGPALSGLEVAIDDEKLTRFPGIALIVEVEFHVTNHDPVPHNLRPSARGSTFYFPPPEDSPEHARVRYAYGTISERRRWELLPPRVEAGKTVHGVYILQFGWNPTGRMPDYTLIVSDGRREYTARPHGAAETVQET